MIERRCTYVAVAALCMVLTSGARAESAGNSKEAKAAFADGLSRFSDLDYVGALRAFGRAWHLDPRPVLHCYIARCHARMGDVLRATRHYKSCLARARLGGRQRRQVRRALAQAHGRLAYIEVSASGGLNGVIYLDGDRRGSTPQRVAVNPGSRTLAVRFDKGWSRQTLTLRGGEVRSLRLEPPQPSKPSKTMAARTRARGPRPAAPTGARISPWWFWAGVSLTAVSAAVAVAYSVRALDAKRRYERQPSQSDLDQLNSSQLIANIFWGATATSAAATTTAFFFADFERKADGRRDARLLAGLSGRF